MAFTIPADAEVVYTHTYKNIPGDFTLDLNGDGIADFGLLNRTFLGHLGGQTLAPAVHGNAVLGYAGSPQMLASALPLGVRVGPGGNFVRQPAEMAEWADSSGFIYSFGPWENVHNKYLGLAF